jgi:hypothetical protein
LRCDLARAAMVGSLWRSDVRPPHKGRSLHWRLQVQGKQKLLAHRLPRQKKWPRPKGELAASWVGASHGKLELPLS